MLQRIAQLGAGSAERPAAGRCARRAGTSSTTSSAQPSRVGLSASRPGAAHFLRPNKAWEGVFKPRAAAEAGDFQQTSPPLRSRSPPSPSPSLRPLWLCWNQLATRVVPFTPRSEGDGDEMFGNPLSLPGKCVCDVGEDTHKSLSSTKKPLWFGYGKSCTVLSKALTVSPSFPLAQQHPSGVKVIRKLAPALMKDPHLNYLGDERLLDLIIALRPELGVAFQCRPTFPLPSLLPSTPMPPCLAGGKMGNISAAQEVLAGPIVRLQGQEKIQEREPIFPGSYHLFLLFAFPKEMGQKEIFL